MRRRSTLSKLFDACRDGDLLRGRRELKGLLDSNVVNHDGHTPLHLAISDKLLTALQFAKLNDRLEVVRMLLDMGADVVRANNEGQTTLLYACRRGHLDVVRLLLEDGTDVNRVDNEGRTPLLYACEALELRHRLEVVRMLLNGGADLNTANNDGMTPLHWACLEGRLEVSRLLLDRGADVTVCVSNRANRHYEMAALHYACYWGHLELVKRLLELGASPDITAHPEYPFTESAKALLRQWSAVTPARSDAIEVAKKAPKRERETDGGGANAKKAKTGSLRLSLLDAQ